ncbi:hypothetical protein LshimejAT787_2100310 [Lyophyllum shimeji]|uniref:Uncharacterized protein n=1 Tax=Lyophyllum shimeji TaxID=47721 RepID=A0A9P3Q237_LYOSH|nr:hypothetical protein LshimejAT787_2100310 [Lyophyllum shimeji]
MTETSAASWSSPFESWHERALLTPHPDPHSFTPTRDNLLLAMLLNAMAEGDGISLALFSQSDAEDSIAVDARGRVLLVSAKDSAGLLSLAKEAHALPKTDSSWNSWRIHRNVTCLPNHELFLRSPTDQGAQRFHQITVYGFSKQVRELDVPVEGFSLLPDTLWELFGLLLEARNGAGSRTGLWYSTL